jgi:signal peptidase I
VGKAIIGAFVVTLFIKIFVFDFMIAEGHSMTPAIKPGTVLLVCRVFYGVKLPLSSSYFVMWRTPVEGQILVFHTPLGEIAVKRCVEVLSDGFFYALGDNSSQSYDSRDYGPVPFTNIIGRVLGIR